MVSAFVSMMLMLTPMNNGHHYGWGKQEGRNVPAYQPVTPSQPPRGNSSPPPVSGSGPSEPGSTRYSN